MQRSTDLALLVNPVNFFPPTRSTLELQTSLLQAFAESGRSFPSVVVRNFAGDMMKDMCLRNTVGSMCTNPPHD